MDNVFVSQMFAELACFDMDEDKKEAIRQIVLEAEDVWFDHGRSDGYDEGWDAGYVQGRADGYDEAMIEMGHDND